MKNIEIIQQEISDCGITCLYSIINYYKGYVPLERLRIMTNTSTNGTTAYELIECAKKLGFISYGVKEKKLNKCDLPLIAHIKLDNNLYHFIVVYKINKNTLTIMDPLIGLKKITQEQFYKQYTGVNIRIILNGNVIKYKKNKYIEKELIKYIKTNKLYFILIIIISITIIIFELIENFEVNILSNNIKYLYYILIIIITNNILNIIKNKISNKKNIEFNNKLSLSFIKKLNILPLKYIKLKQSGEISTRFNELNELSSNIINLIINIILNITILLILLIILFLINKKIMLFIILISTIYIIINIKLYKKIIKNTQSLIEKDEIYNQNIIDIINNIDTIKHINNNYFINKFKNIITDKNKLTYKIKNKINKINIINNIFQSIIILGIIYIIINNNLKTINSITYLIICNYYINIIKNIINIYPNIIIYKIYINNNNELFNIEYNNKEQIEYTNITILINNLSYQINNNIILNNINYKINNNDKIFIKGPSGIGKSTFLKILNNEITLYDGLITINNKNIKDISLDNTIIYSTIDDNIFNDTIKNNILLGKNISDKTLNKIIKICRIDQIEIVKKCGLDVMLINNNYLSGGEKSRILLARILVHKKKIIILDEILEYVDINLEKEIIKDLIYYLKDNILLYVSHKDVEELFSKVLTFRKE